VAYDSIQNEPTLSDDGRLDFFSSLRGAGVTTDNDSALFLGKPDDVHLLVREGDVAPQTGGARFRGWDWPHLNARGDALFLALLTGDGVGSDNDKSIFATDPTGAFHLLAREGDPFEVAPGDVRIVADCDYYRPYTTQSGGDGRPRALNDLGEVGLWLKFADGSSGLFVASIPVPEPAGALAASTLLLIAGARRAARRTARATCAARPFHPIMH
jgi:hypothetical protein